MPLYDSADFDPPAPIARVSFINPATGQQVDDVPMLLDTGADASVVPHSVFQSLNASAPVTQYEIEYLEGDKATWSSIHLQMKWRGLNFTGEFLVARTGHGVIGRNILNHLRLTFDGPTLEWDIG